MGAVAAPLLVVRTLEPRLTDVTGDTSRDAGLLRAYIRREVKLVDVVFASVLISGILLAQLYTGWTPWVLTKIGLFIAQFVATMAYIQIFHSSTNVPTSITPLPTLARIVRSIAEFLRHNAAGCVLRKVIRPPDRPPLRFPCPCATYVDLLYFP